MKQNLELTTTNRGFLGQTATILDYTREHESLLTESTPMSKCIYLSIQKWIPGKVH